MKKRYKYLVIAGNTGEFVGQSNTITQILQFLGATKRDLFKTNTGYTVWDKYTIVKN